MARNLVAKFAHQFNRATVERSKKQYNKKIKHKKVYNEYW